MNASHLDDELLSAALDHDEIGSEAEAHLAACGTCRGRLDALAAAAAAVAVPLPPPAGLREAAVARALDAADRGEAASGSPSRSSRRWVPAAAAVVVVLLGVTFALRNGDGDDAGNMQALQDAAALDGGDLGALDAASLREHVQGTVEGTGAADGSVASGQTTDNESSETGAGGQDSGATGGGTGDDAGPGAPSMLRSSAPRTASTAACERVVTKTYADKLGLGPLVYRATGMWENEQAAVLAYRIEGARGPLDHSVFVLALSDCRLLATQTF